MHKQTIELVGFVKEFDKFLSVLFAAEGRLDIKERVLRRVDKHFFSEREAGQSLEAIPVFDEAVFEYGFGVGVFFGEGGVEIDFSFFVGGGILLDKGGHDDIWSFLAGKSHFRVERSHFHNQGNSILMIKTLGDIHY